MKSRCIYHNKPLVVSYTTVPVRGEGWVRVEYLACPKKDCIYKKRTGNEFPLSEESVALRGLPEIPAVE